MEARDCNFGFIEQENSIEVPYFQRPYVWEQDEWEQLFTDLKESYYSQRDHFLGSVVLKQLASSSGEGAKRSLVDGQQRLTTFSILIKSLYDQLDDEDKIDYAKYLFQTPTKEKIPKIKHSKFDQDMFCEILKAKQSSDIADTIDNRLLECYKYFSQAIDEIKCINHSKTKKEQARNCRYFLDFILIKKLWVTIDLGVNEDEQKIFDSINTTGLKLTATDIIKNAIFQKALRLKTDHERLYRENWEFIFDDIENRGFWEKETSSGRLKRVQSEIFLHAFAMIDGFFIQKTHSLEGLRCSISEK